MGFIFFISRIWDAVSDPLAGYLSDRTRTRWGRRRPWLVAGAIPVGLVFYAMWAPPTDLPAGTSLSVWMGGAIILFYTGMTIFNMPHDSLAAELSDNYEDRNRIFGIRRAFFGVGAIFVFGAVAWLSQSSDPRGDARSFAAVGAVVTPACMLLPGLRIRERSEFPGRFVPSRRCCGIHTRGSCSACSSCNRSAWGRFSSWRPSMPSTSWEMPSSSRR